MTSRDLPRALSRARHLPRASLPRSSQAKFQLNGGCGYVLKPRRLRRAAALAAANADGAPPSADGADGAGADAAASAAFTAAASPSPPPPSAGAAAAAAGAPPSPAAPRSPPSPRSPPKGVGGGAPAERGRSREAPDDGQLRAANANKLAKLRGLDLGRSADDLEAVRHHLLLTSLP